MSGNDLGTDTGAVALNAGMKVFEAILNALWKMLNAIGIAWKEHPDRKLKSMQIKKEKDYGKKIKLIKELSGVEGYIQYNKFKEYLLYKGENPTVRHLVFADEEQKNRFIKACADYGLPWSAVEDKADGLKISVFISEKDVEKLQRVREFTMDAEKIIEIDKRIESILNGKSKDELDEVAQKNIELLENERASIQSKWTNDFNISAYSEELDNIMFSHRENITEEEWQRFTCGFEYESFDDKTFAKKDAFSAVLDANTGKEIDKDRFSVVGCASDPDKFIVCHGEALAEPNEFHQNIVTSYEVHNANGDVKMFTDDKTINPDWQNVKEQMRVFGGFSEAGSGELYLRFNNADEFERWRVIAIKERDNENVRKINDSEIASALERRKEELASKGYEIKNGVVYNTAENKPVEETQKALKAKISKTEKHSPDYYSLLMARANEVEASVIGKEIKNYEELIECNAKLAQEKTNLAIANMNGNKEEISVAESQLSKVQSEYDKLKDKQSRILTHRENINATQSKIQADRADNVYNLSHSDKTVLYDLESKYGELGIGKENIFELIANSKGTERVSALAEIARQTEDKAMEVRSKGGNYQDYIDFGNAVYSFQSKQLELVKQNEPTVFKSYSNADKASFFNLNESDISKLSECADWYSSSCKLADLPTVSKADFMNEITSNIGMARLNVYLKRSAEIAMIIEAMKKNGMATEHGIDLERYLGDLAFREQDRIREFCKSESPVYSGGQTINALEDKGLDKADNMENYSKDIKDAKVNNPIGKNVGGLEKGMEKGNTPKLSKDRA